MTVLRVNTTDEHVFPRQRNASPASGGRGYCPAAQGWARGLERRSARQRDVIPEKRRPLPAFSREGIRRDFLTVALSLILILFLCILATDLSAMFTGGTRIGRLSVGISSLEESNSLLRQELSRAESRAFSARRSDAEPGRTVILSPAPEE